MPSAAAVSAAAAVSSAMRWARLAAVAAASAGSRVSPSFSEGQEHQQQGRRQRVQAENRVQGRDHQDEDRRPGCIEEGDHAFVGEEGLEVGEGARAAVPSRPPPARRRLTVASMAGAPSSRSSQSPIRIRMLPSHAAQEAEHGSGSDREHGQPEQRAVGAAGEHTVEELHQVDRAHQRQQVDGEAEARDRPELAPDDPAGAAHERGRIAGPQLLPRWIGGDHPRGIRLPGFAHGPGGFHGDKRSPRHCRRLHSATRTSHTGGAHRSQPINYRLSAAILHKPLPASHTPVADSRIISASAAGCRRSAP